MRNRIFWETVTLSKPIDQQLQSPIHLHVCQRSCAALPASARDNLRPASSKNLILWRTCSCFFHKLSESAWKEKDSKYVIRLNAMYSDDTDASRIRSTPPATVKKASRSFPAENQQNTECSSTRWNRKWLTSSSSSRPNPPASSGGAHAPFQPRAVSCLKKKGRLPSFSRSPQADPKTVLVAAPRWIAVHARRCLPRPAAWNSRPCAPWCVAAHGPVERPARLPLLVLESEGLTHHPLYRRSVRRCAP